MIIVMQEPKSTTFGLVSFEFGSFLISNGLSVRTQLANCMLYYQSDTTMASLMVVGICLGLYFTLLAHSTGK